ncbi:hypothetical protein PQ478_08560 [Alkalihalophilus pseudofirmus]|uniref:hypothetical protein n=1 Tax=Alkalihalophilus pseudofirmus TaxID=79885 RepID=UPI00259BBD82|nr:hypothetical protein [Alkalihalophilus pseudofirmus]WEG18520.1 hypothetical protein PQ478_08560 [Alkalihalophilus pseudofirmus]
MQNKQFYTLKFKSSRLKEFNYDISITFEQAKKFKEVIALFDNQMLRSIRDIKRSSVSYADIDKLEKEKKLNKNDPTKLKHTIEKLNKMLYIPEYVTIVMDHPSHYKYMYENKIKINENFYRRFSCSAGQARVSTVVFVEESIADKLDKVLDNGRDLNKQLVPSKLNAYKGLAGSATMPVSTPRFCLVPDYYSDSEVKVNFVTETGLNDDDIIVEKTITESFNRFDGQGLISYEMAKKWADELKLDYVPAQWCVRQNYIKGMLNTFPIHEFCKTENDGKTLIETSYKDGDGNPILADLSEIDVIITDSQFKLWDSFASIEEYKGNCEKNNLKWGVTLHSPKKDKDILKMNYQFLQTLNLNKEDIEQICKKFVDWILGVSTKDVYQTLLFLLGTDITEEKLNHFLQGSDNHWIKALAINNDLIRDRYFKKKVYDLLKRKIKLGCLGQILIDGNFQTLVSDPYAMMQHVCGIEVTGLLKKREYYSNYWSRKGVKVVDSMRAPLTYRSEHLLLGLRDDEMTNHWYRYNYTGIIVNAHGSETMNWAGSDFDYDIIATTSDPTVIKGVYKDELPVVYEAPKSEKKVLTDEDLYKADIFSFGSAIGAITNKSTSGYALLPTLNEDSAEFEVTMNRIKMCTKLQSAQIDKAKIGRAVKGIPKTWVNYHKVKDEDTEEERKIKEFNNTILLDKHPYFFTYLYKGTRNKYKKHVDSYNITCKQKFGMTIDELKSLKRKSLEQKEFLKLYYKLSPVIDSDCVMNNLCRYIESIDFNIRSNNATIDDERLHELLMSSVDVDSGSRQYRQVVKAYSDHKKSVNEAVALSSSEVNQVNGFDEHEKLSVDEKVESFKADIYKLKVSTEDAINILVHYFYIKQPKSNKDLLWRAYGEEIYQNVKNNSKKTVLLPYPDPDGDIDYLGEKYKLKEVNV